MIRRLLRVLRIEVYRRGYRPARGSLLYSPSLDMQYAWLDTVKAGIFRAGPD